MHSESQFVGKFTYKMNLGVFLFEKIDVVGCRLINFTCFMHEN